MAAHSQRLILVVVAALAAAATLAGQTTATPTSPRRIVSLVPALTEMLFAIGAGPQVVAVSSFDDFPAAVSALPRVGALLDPDTERILALRPDLVLTYGSQTQLEAQLERAGIRTFSYRHGGIETVLGTMRDLGGAVGRALEADRATRDIRARLEATRTRVRGRRQPRTLLVFERRPGTLQQMYVSGGRGFLHEMMTLAGGANVFADVDRESVQPSHETLLARAPEAIIEVRATAMIGAAAEDVRTLWSALAAIPAVRTGRIHVVQGQYLVVPGPRLADATETLARTLHPEAYR
jgi:iron complex transport system substrate-binding protein